MKVAILLLSLLVVSSGYFINDAFAAISENQPFLLEGSGFAVTEESIKISEIDLALSSQQKSGSSINFLAENGFVTIDEDEFVISNLKGKFLREGNYIRISGTVESSSGFDSSISFFGRLVDESKDASVYGFTGRITTTDDTYKIIYTAKLSKLTKITTSAEPAKPATKTIQILKGASSIDSLKYFSSDRITVEPGTTITIVNNDVVSHSILSGKENYGDRYNRYTADGRISTGEILPGASVSITFSESGFYRLYDPDYDYMGIVAYVFKNPDSLILGTSKNLGN